MLNGADTERSAAALSRRTLLAATACLLASGRAAMADEPVYALVVRRDPGCPCCHLWVAKMEETGRFSVVMTEEADMPAYKQSLGLPADLASCHTGVVEGLVLEGHVPPEDALRLLVERPAGVVGLAVPGMPLGSPGMDVPDGRRQAYAVFAFAADGSRSAFARYEALEPTL